jgi:hypothetical protein
METVKINVRFVKPKGYIEPLAVFMGQNAGIHYNSNAGVWLRMSYQHTGQHGECTNHFLRSKRATLEEYTPLLKELESIGYNVTIK